MDNQVDFKGLTNRIKQLRIKLDITQVDFAKSINISLSLLRHMDMGIRDATLKTASKIITTYPQVNEKWLLYDIGEPFLKNDMSEPPAFGPKLQIKNSISLLDITAGASLREETEMGGSVIATFGLPNLNGEGLLALTVEGDSMNPTFHCGDTIVVQRIGIERFKNDEIYLIDIEGSLPILKRVRREGSQFKFSSDNPVVNTYHIPEEEVRGLYKIQAHIRMFSK